MSEMGDGRGSSAQFEDNAISNYRPNYRRWAIRVFEIHSVGPATPLPVLYGLRNALHTESTSGKHREILEFTQGFRIYQMKDPESSSEAFSLVGLVNGSTYQSFILEIP